MTAAFAAGLSVFPLTANKRPAVREWKPFMERLPGLDEMKIWQASDYSGYAVVMGGPERLLAVDLEAGFVAGHLAEFAARLRDAELEATWSNWLEGYCAQTPSQGLHVVIHLMGDGPMPGNEKLAADGAGKVLAETRAQGGYIVGYGSGGDVHPSGAPWILGYGGYDQIAWAEPEEWAGVRAVLVSFDEAPLAPAGRQGQPAAVPNPPAGGVSLAQLERSSSWIDTAAEQAPSMAEVLARYGWQPHHRDADYEYWTRPGKPLRDGHSATVNASDRLFVFSSNAHPVPASPGRTTYDVVDVIGFYEGVDRIEVLRRWKPAWVPRETSGSSLVLPDWFWETTPLLAHIRRAAWSRRICPDTLFEAVKCLYAASIPWNFRLPDDGTLDYVGLMVGNSGSGKTRSKKAALALMPPELLALDGIRLSMPAPSSGEGIVEAFIKRLKGKQVGLEYRGLNFYIDEGQSFFSVLDRSGNTLAEVLKSAWVGEMTGNTAASQERHRVLTPGEVRVSALIGVQIDVAAQFLTAAHTNGGLPQRAVWSWAYHPDRTTDDAVDWPGPLPVTVYDRMTWGGGDGQHIIHRIGLEEPVQNDLWARQDARADSPDSGLLDAHAEYSILKTAAVLALMHGQTQVTSQFWNLAGTNWQTSVNVREEVQRRHANTITDRDVALGRAQAARNIASDEVYLDRAIASLIRKVRNNDGPLTATEAKNHLSSYRKRHKLAYTEIVDAAIARGGLVIHSSGGLTPP